MIDQLEQLDVNGSRQWALYRSEDIDKPVILFVHGGPGSPLMLFSRGFDEVFLKDFIIVHWDQRDSGKSFDPNLPISSFTAEQVAKDGLVVVDHLKRKFNRSKILLVGHSWGSIVGAQMAKMRPNDFIAYVSVGTVADMHRGDEMKYNFLVESVSKSGDATDQADLQTLGRPPWLEFPKIIIQSRLMTKYKGSFYALNSEQINAAVRKTTDYSEADFETLDISMEKIWHQIFPFLSNYIAAKSIPSLGVKTVFVHGVHDMATPMSLAKEYFGQFQSAEGKEWVEFSGSAHFPMYEEPLKFLDILKQAARE